MQHVLTNTYKKKPSSSPPSRAYFQTFFLSFSWLYFFSLDEGQSLLYSTNIYWCPSSLSHLNKRKCWLIQELIRVKFLLREKMTIIGLEFGHRFLGNNSGWWKIFLFRLLALSGRHTRIKIRLTAILLIELKKGSLLS